MARYEELENRTFLMVYFADPHSPWQRPTNENTNGQLSQHLPKGTNLSQYSRQYLTKVADEMNNRSRESMGSRAFATLGYFEKPWFLQNAELQPFDFLDRLFGRRSLSKCPLEHTAN